MRLSTFAEQVGQILVAEAPDEFVLRPCRGLKISIRIEAANKQAGHTWDSVFVNGKFCGNRLGGVREFTRLVCHAKPELICT